MTGNIDCAQRCEIPAGIAMREMPPTRHAWGDIKRCPNDDCGKFFMVKVVDKPSAGQVVLLTGTSDITPPTGERNASA